MHIDYIPADNDWKNAVRVLRLIVDGCPSNYKREENRAIIFLKQLDVEPTLDRIDLFERLCCTSRLRRRSIEIIGLLENLLGWGRARIHAALLEAGANGVIDYEYNSRPKSTN